MPANLENSAVTIGLGKVNFHSNPKEGQCQRMFKLMHNCTHLTGSHSNAQNSPSEASKYLNCELPDVQKAEEPEMKLPTSTGSLKSNRVPEKYLLLIYWLCQSLWLCGSLHTAENSETHGNTRPPYLPLEESVYRSKSKLESDMEQWTNNGLLFPTGQRVLQGCILSPYLFDLYAEYIMWNDGLNGPQAGIKIARRNISNLRYTDDTTFTEESEEELKRLLMKEPLGRVKKLAWNSTFKKTKIMTSSPPLHGK